MSPYSGVCSDLTAGRSSPYISTAKETRAGYQTPASVERCSEAENGHSRRGLTGMNVEKADILLGWLLSLSYELVYQVVAETDRLGHWRKSLAASKVTFIHMLCIEC